MPNPVNSKASIEEGTKYQTLPHWFCKNNPVIAKFCGLGSLSQEMPAGKRTIPYFSSSDASSIHDMSHVPALEVDDDPTGKTASDMQEGGQSPEQRYGHFGGAESAARTVYREQLTDQDTLNSTQSLYDADITYIMIHGRRYCKDYYMPNDREEQDRTELLHTIYFYVFDQRLTNAPLHNPTKILDIGTGTGEWAMAMGDEYPDAEIIGTDIAKIQPSAVPLNVFFEIDDAEEEGGWTWPENEFDLIHFRTMMGAFKSWKAMYEESFKHLKPGGWIEVIDFDDHKKLMSYFSGDPLIPEWLAAIGEATRLSGRPRSSAHLEPEVLEAVGFVECSQTTHLIPIGDWADDPETQTMGKHFLVTQLCGIEALCLRPLTEGLGWDPVEVRRICNIVIDGVRAIAMDPQKAKGMGFTVKCLLGRKPGGPPTENGAT